MDATPGPKINCWQFKQCGREPGGAKVAELGICPATVDTSANRLNSGLNGGRICWGVSGTFCGGQVQGSFAAKRRSCMSCEFFKMVMAEEEPQQFRLLKYRKFVEILPA